MKFAKELERDLVPEWRLKYLNYKLAKKKLKAVRRALRNIESTPRLRWRGTNTQPSPYDAVPKYSYLNHDHTRQGETASTRHLRTIAITNNQNSLRQRANGSRPATEEEPLTRGPSEIPGLGTSYGSFIASPPDGGQTSSDWSKAPPSLKLPGAALDPENISQNVGPATASPRQMKTVTLPDTAVEPGTDNAFEVGRTRLPKHKRQTSLPDRYKAVFGPKRMNSLPTPATENRQRPSVLRMFSMSHGTPPVSPGDVPLEAYRDLDVRQAEFFNFLDAELEKIETFYKEKEDEATHRLVVLRDQLHIMRDRRIDDIISRQTAKTKHKSTRSHEQVHLMASGQGDSSDEVQQVESQGGNKTKESWLDPVDAALDAINAGKYGKSTKNIAALSTPAALQPKDHPDSRRDFARRPGLPDVPYRTAKRKLKTALQEYYRGLELLKSYVLLNQTAFRKINKKYDKVLNARPAMRYMSDKVNKAWFVNSDVIESHIRATEDLYARYFERGNHKVAMGKLRVKIFRDGDYTDNAFRNGLLLSAGFILSVQGFIKADSITDIDDPSSSSLAMNTSFLLQIYGGYFLIDLLLLLFCLVCRVWHDNKINYVFIFEYDTRHYLDWRQLAELPCWCFLMLGLFMQINFHQVGGDRMYLWYPIILIGLSVALLINPFRICYFRTRMWLLYSLWRLLLAGLYPVEWRDFYMGDMFCSLTYSISNMSLLFCLYARGWNQPPMCGSSHSRVLGFLTTLPGIWRALQCIRRYWDTGNKFPHLLNCGKYMATILFYVTLSVYRIDQRTSTRIVFIVFAIINGIYTSFWDIYYDWSLGDPHAKHRFLRKQLAYKRIWWYYAAMIIDPVLRFIWVLYLIIPLQLQHSAGTGFFVAVVEICRRAMWSVFRVENEHSANVGRFRASRDVPLPYDVPSSIEDLTASEIRNQRFDEEQPHTPTAAASLQDAAATGLNLQRTTSTARRRRGKQDEARPSPFQRTITQVGDIFRDAHVQDFERKRKSELGDDLQHDRDEDTDDDSEDEQEESGEDKRSGGSHDSEREMEDDENEGDISRIREDLEVGMSGARNGRPIIE